MIKRPKFTKRALPAAITLGLLAPAGFSPAVLGQEADGLEEIVITGSRGRPRTVADSPVPVDVFSAEDLQDVSYTDTNDILRTLVQSFNLARQPISDGAIHASFILHLETSGVYKMSICLSVST